MTRAARALALAALICLTGCATEVDGPAAPGASATSAAPGTEGVGAGSRAAELRNGAVRVAERAAVALTSLGHRDSDAAYDRLLALLTGPARQEWEQQRAEYLGKLRSDGVTSQGSVLASGVAALDPAAGTATVLVAATAAVSTAQAPDPEQRRYRLRMSLVAVPAEEGAEATQWRVAELRFVS